MGATDFSRLEDAVAAPVVFTEGWTSSGGAFNKEVHLESGGDTDVAGGFFKVPDVEDFPLILALELLDGGVVGSVVGTIKGEVGVLVGV